MPIAVVCAIAEELRHVQEALPPAREEWHAGRAAWLTSLDHRPIVLCRCGIGMVSAAAATEALIARYAPAAVINYGCAGAHRVDLLPGDVAVGTRVVAYANTREEPDGTSRAVGTWYLRQGELRRADAFEPASELLAAAERAAAALEGQHLPWPAALAWPEAIAHRLPRLHFGTVLSADRWNRSRATIEALAAAHDSLCEDMEAAAIAATCASHDVPFIAVKDVSNNELLRATDLGAALTGDVRTELGRRAGAFVLALLGELATAP